MTQRTPLTLGAIPGTTPGDHADQVESLLDALADTYRRRAELHAEEAALLAAAVDLAQTQDDVPGPSEVRDIPLRSLAAQIGAALKVTDRTVQRKMSDATLLVSRFSATFAALAAGEISPGHMNEIVDAGTPIADDEVRAEFEAAALDIARRETASRLRPAVRLLAARLHAVPLDERHAQAAKVRDVWVRDLDDGMADLIATLPAYLAHGIRDRLDRIARSEIDARTAPAPLAEASSPIDPDAGADTLVSEPTVTDCRRIGEIRADVFAGLLLTGHATTEISNASIPESEAIVAHVQVIVPVMTVLGEDTAPAEIVGRAPIDTATALRLAATAPGWDRVLTHPVSGSVLAVDRYRPTGHLKRVLRVRDEHCRFPGCRMPARRCDIDHTTAREHDGPTEVTNLAHLCRRHHTLKHHSAWRVRQTPDGVLHWTSPTGREYPDRPARTLVFTTEPDPEPPPPF